MRAIQNQINIFLNSKASTLRGVKEIKSKQVLSLANTFDFTMSEAESLYRLFEDKDFTSFIPDRIGGSEAIILFQDAISQKLGKEQFLERFKMYVDGVTDVELKGKVSKLYNKYVRFVYEV